VQCLHSFPTRRSSDLKQTCGCTSNGTIKSNNLLKIWLLSAANNSITKRVFTPVEIKPRIKSAKPNDAARNSSILCARSTRKPIRSEEHTSELQSRENL